MNTRIASISPELLYHRLQQGEDMQIVDVRSGRDYLTGHIPDSISVPLSGNPGIGFLGNLRTSPVDPDRTVFLLANTRQEALRGAERLQMTDAGQPVIVEGGIDSWRSSGYPIETPKSILESLAQSRTMAGVVLVLSAILGHLVSPAFLLIVAAVGCGLMLPAKLLPAKLVKGPTQTPPRTLFNRSASRISLRNSDCPS